MLNWLDLILVGFLIIAALFGMLRGVKRQIVTFLGIGAALLASLGLYQELTPYIGRLFRELSASGREAIAFLFLFIFISNAISYALRTTFIPPETRLRAGPLDDHSLGGALKRLVWRFIISPLNLLGGMFLAFVSTAIWLSLLLAVTQFSLRTPWGMRDDVRFFFLRGIAESQFTQSFNVIFWTTSNTINTWLPTLNVQLPAIFTGTL
ncbi:MAG: CvpA family protein [Anaerolineae bacterium]